MKAPVLIIEDGFEYIDRANQWLAEDFEFTRAGSGQEALLLLKETPFELIYLDMNFNRTDAELLLGPLGEMKERFGGDEEQALEFLFRHQGLYILAEIRGAGCLQPVLISYDFSAEPKRWQHLKEKYDPIQFLSDNVGPDQVRTALTELLSLRS